MSADWERARGVQIADVYKAGVLAATLRRAAEGVVFDYDPRYREAGGLPVASTLPLGKAAVLTPAGAVPAFFAGLLPEGRRLVALRRAVKTSADDELSLLVAVGADTIGDVQVVPRGEAPERPPVRVIAEDWRDISFRQLATDEAGVDLSAVPGVQDKVSAAMIAVPTAGLYILKLSPPEYPSVVENEAFFLRAAQRSGVPVAEAEVVTDAEGERGLLVRRFDRVLTEKSELVALAQEDACQALGRYPADKYNVTAEEAVSALVSLTRAKPVAARDLVQQAAFAYLTGNGDQHAKDLSVVRLPTGEWRTSPAYDVPSTYPYGDVTMALPIAGRTREDITRESFLQFGLAVGVTERATAKLLGHLCDAVDSWINDLDALPFDELRRHKLTRVVRDRRDKLAARPAAGRAAPPRVEG